VFGYSEQQYRAETIEKLAAVYIKQLEQLIEQCRHVIVPEYTPSDVPLAQLSQGELNAIIKKIKKL
jgi:non-ribosomal peptide synthase protein (TIGR01720 family)